MNGPEKFGSGISEPSLKIRGTGKGATQLLPHAYIGLLAARKPALNIKRRPDTQATIVLLGGMPKGGNRGRRNDL